MVIADDDELDAFWDIAREHADLSGVPVYMGANPVRTLRPPAWAFGATPEQSDELLSLVRFNQEPSDAVFDHLGNRSHPACNHGQS